MSFSSYSPDAQATAQSALVSLPDVLACWRRGKQITGGRWFNLFYAAPNTTTPSLQQRYVLKLINPFLPESERAFAIDRLGREAHATEQIVHPNVMRLLDAELDTAPFYLVQPWTAGRTLDQVFSRASHLPLTRMLWLFRQIAEGIRAGHEKGRVYLGLDPSHVLIGKTGRVTLIGWSQSHPVESLAWLPTDKLQSARYSAPECFESEYWADPASDVYALGVLIHHTLSGKAPFDGTTVEAIAAAQQNEIPADLQFTQPDCPTRLAHLAKRMLAKRPQMRPGFSEVLNELISIEIEHLSDQRLIRL